ncbi:MAG: hypothetical protein QHH04_03620 [Methanolinea sp.]|nr:hypothetical protein [Methanolinea sp.]
MKNIPRTDAPQRRELDITLEAGILLVLSVFMLVFGILLFPIHTGDLPYAPDSTYGLFLVIVSLQVITLGKTPFGDVRRSWLVVIAGIAASVIGMGACFIPAVLSAPVRILAGVLLLAGGAALLFQLAFREDRAAAWLKSPGILRHLALACGLVYLLMVLLGLVTLLPVLAIDALTAVLLLVAGASLLYLAWCIQVVRKMYPESAFPPAGTPSPGQRFPLLREAPLTLTTALLLFLGVLLAFLAVLLVPVSTGTLPFSPDGQLGLLLVIMAIQVLAMGETPVGRFRRSWALVAAGLAFVALGVFSCIVPGILTDMLRVMLGVLNLAGGVVPLSLRVFPLLQQGGKPKAPVPPPLRNLLLTQTVLNVVGILFGTSMLLPGLIPGMVTAAILFCNGILLFLLARILSGLPTEA